MVKSIGVSTSTAAIALLASTVLITWLAFRSAGDPIVTTASSTEPGAQAIPAQTSSMTSPIDDAHERKDASNGLLVLHGVTGLAVGNAKLILVGDDPSFLPSALEIISVSDAKGYLPRPAQPDKVVLFATGFIPRTIDATPSTSVVRLFPANPIGVRVVSEVGNPIRGALVTLQSSSSSRRVFPTDGPLTGNPRHQDPLWNAVTDDSGYARFAELPDKKFCLRVASNSHIAVSEIALGRQSLVPPAEVAVTMESVWGLCVQHPGNAPMETWEWLVEQGDLDLSSRVISQLEPSRRQIQDEHPDSLCLVGRPTDPNRPAPIGCRVVMRDGTVWKAKWPMQPMDRVTPVFLEPDADRKAKRVHFMVTGPGNVRVPLKLAVYDKIENRRQLVDGESMLLVYGTYKLMPVPMAPWLESAFASAIFDVKADSPTNDTVEVTLNDTLSKMIVHIDVVQQRLTSPVHMQLTDSANRRINIANIDSLEDREYMVPTGAMRVKITGAGYDDALATVDVNGATTVTMTLRVRP